MSGIDDVYRKIVEVEVRVKSCGNRSFCHGRWRSCGDWRWRFKVDTCRNVLVSCYPSIDRFAKKVHRKCHLPSFHNIRVYFVSRFARIFYGNDVSRSQLLFFTQLDIYIYIIRGRDYVEKILEASNVFTLRKRKSVFEKMFNNRNVIEPNPDFDNTSLIVK